MSTRISRINAPSFKLIRSNSWDYIIFIVMLSQSRYQYSILFILIPFPDPYTHKTIPTLILILQPTPRNRQLRQWVKRPPALPGSPLAALLTNHLTDYQTEHPPDCDSLLSSPADSSNNKSLRQVNIPHPPEACLSALPT